MSESIWKAPQALLSETLLSSRRHVVLIVGAGLHRQLVPSCGRGCDNDATECFRLLSDWNALVKSVAIDARLNPMSA